MGNKMQLKLLLVLEKCLFYRENNYLTLTSTLGYIHPPQELTSQLQHFKRLLDNDTPERTQPKSEPWFWAGNQEGWLGLVGGGGGCLGFWLFERFQKTQC